MSPTVNGALGPLLLQNVSGSFAREAKPSETVRTIVKWQEIPAVAFERARIRPKEIAGIFQKSASWVSRALRGLERLGWSDDLANVQDKQFWSEVVEMICAFHGIEPPGVSAQDLEFMRIGRAACELQSQIARSVSR